MFGVLEEVTIFMHDLSDGKGEIRPRGGGCDDQCEDGLGDAGLRSHGPEQSPQATG